MQIQHYIVSKSIKNTTHCRFIKTTDCRTFLCMGNFIRAIREDRGLTAEQLAKRVNTTQQQISLLEKKRNLRWEWIMRLSTALECHPMDITAGPAKPRTQLERELLEKFRRLEEPLRNAVYKIMDIELPANIKQQKTKPT